MISVVVPYYRNPKMLELHLKTWANYSQEVRDTMRLIIVDDGSPEPAEPIVSVWNKQGRLPVELYRIKEDIPWNRGGARNLGTDVAQTPWLLHMDIDHILPAASALQLTYWFSAGDETPHPRNWYRFMRFRVGEADETRNKDSITRDCKFGPVKPHIDSYLCSKALYWSIGGYDEDYSGCLGGGSPFLKQMEEASSPTVLPYPLHVYTRHAVPDSSDMSLSRDTREYSRRRKAKEAAGNTKAKNPLRFTWERQL